MSYDPNYVDGLACRLAEERAAAEVALIAGILSEPSGGIAAAEREGVHRGWFAQDDLRAIYVAADYGHRRGKPVVLRFARFLLAHLSLWDEADSRAFTRGMHWCPESLVSLACSCVGPIVVTGYARRLKTIIARQRQARACCRQLIGLLNGTIEPAGPSFREGRNHLLLPHQMREGEKHAHAN